MKTIYLLLWNLRKLIPHLLNLLNLHGMSKIYLRDISHRTCIIGHIFRIARAFAEMWLYFIHPNNRQSSPNREKTCHKTNVCDFASSRNDYRESRGARFRMLLALFTRKKCFIITVNWPVGLRSWKPADGSPDVSAGRMARLFAAKTWRLFERRSPSFLIRSYPFLIRSLP